MSNPFNDALDWALQGKRVRVYTDHGVVEGWVDRVHHNRGSLVMHDCYDEARDAEIGSTFVRTADRVDVLKPRKRIEFRAVDDLQAHPAHPEGFEPRDAVVRRCYRNQFAGGYPVVRGDGTILNGHKRIAAAQLAGLDEHPVEVVDVTDAQADELFALAHRDDEGVEDATLASDDEDRGDAGDEFDCPDCDRSFETEQGRNHHRTSVHGDRDRLSEQAVDDMDEVIEDDDADTTDSAPISDLADDISGLGEVGVDALEAAGYETVADLEGATKTDLRAADQIGGSIADRLLLATMDDPPTCEECEQAFTSERALAKHEADVHADDDDEEDDLDDDDDEDPDDGRDDQEGDDVPDRWCGYCGAGPFEGDTGVDEHHDEEDHPGDPVVKPSDPAEADWVAVTIADGDEYYCPDCGREFESSEKRNGHWSSRHPDSNAIPREYGGYQPGSLPTECCGTTCETSLEFAVHRTEQHGERRRELDQLEPGEFEEVVEDADEVADIFEAVPWSSERTLRLLGIYGLDDLVGGNVELSDLNDFEFDGVDDARDQEDEPDADQETTTDDPDPAPEPDRPDPDDPDFDGAAYRGGVATSGGDGS